MFLGFINTKINNKHMLLSHYSVPYLICNAGEIQLWLIKTTCFTYLLLQIKPLMIKTLNFKLENLSFNKILKKKDMLYSIKIIINLKWKICINFFESLIKGILKLRISFIFLTYFHYFILFWGTIFWDSIAEKYFMIWYSLVQPYVDVWLFNKNFNH